MNAFQKCVNTSDIVPLYLPQQLFLKPIARMNITVQLTQKMLGKTIMHHEVMEKLRELIRPDEFTLLKVTKTTIEMVRFEAEVELKNKVSRVVSKLDNKMIKLKDFKELMKVRAAEPKLDFPTRRDWDAYFQEAKDMNEMKPGERPDTVHLSNLPTKWFVAHNHRNSDDLYPSEKIFYHTFEKFGSIRMVDIPICDPYRIKMKSHITGIQTSSFEETDFFEGYIQFKDYIGFSKCMDCLRGMKLLHKDNDENYTINVYVTFDKTKHLSEATLRRREIVRDRLIFKQKDKEEKEKQVEEKKKQIEQLTRQQQLDIQNGKEKRRREREEKRKAKILAELKVKGTDDISDKIAKEERKLVKVQRRLEAIRLVEELFKRIKTKIDKNIEPEIIKSHKTDKVSKMKMLSEYKVKTQQEKLHSAIEGRVILKSIISKESKNVNESSSDSDSSLISDIEESVPNNVYAQPLNGVSWYDYLHTMPSYNMQPYCPPRHFPPYFNRGRGNSGPSRFPYNNRPYNNRGRGRGAFNHYLQQEYYKYAQDAINREPRYRRRSYSRSRSHSRHRTRSRSYSRSKSRSYSRNRSKSRDRRTGSRSVSSRRSHRRSRSHSRASDRRSRSHSRATDRRSRSKSRNRSRTRDASFKNGRSRSRRRSSSKDKNNEGNRRSWSRSRGDSKTKNKP